MKKKAERRKGASDQATMRAEYDFAGAVRGATVARYRRGAKVVAIDADLLDVFPDAASVNEALRAIARVVRQHRRPRRKRRSA